VDTTDDSSGQTRDARGRRRRIVVLAVLVALLGACYAWWREDGRHLFHPKNWGVVEEGRVYRSGRIYRGIVKDVLAEHHVQVVVDLAGTDRGDPDFEPEREAARELGIEHVTFSDLNGYGLGSFEDYAQAFALLLEARRDHKPILVHCGGGSERTGAIFAWYRMLLHGWSGAEAWDEYLFYRAREPKSDELRTFVNAHFPEIVKRMRARGLIVKVPDPLPVFGPAGASLPTNGE